MPSDLTAAGHVRGWLFRNPESINSEWTRWIFYERNFSTISQLQLYTCMFTKHFPTLRGWIPFKFRLSL